MQDPSIWKREIPWPNFSARTHRIFALAWAALSVVGTASGVLKGDQGLWYLSIPGFFLALLGNGYLRRSLGASGAGKAFAILFAIWFLTAMWWNLHDEVALGAAMIAFEIPMVWRGLSVTRVGRYATNPSLKG